MTNGANAVTGWTSKIVTQ